MLKSPHTSCESCIARPLTVQQYGTTVLYFTCSILDAHILYIPSGSITTMVLLCTLLVGVYVQNEFRTKIQRDDPAVNGSLLEFK